MGYKEIDKNLSSVLYSDIINYGGLSNSIDEILKIVDCNLRTTKNAEFPLPFPCARIENGNRSSQIMLAAKERMFHVDLWCDGVCYGGWCLKELIEVANFIKHSIELQLSVDDLEKNYLWFISEKGKIPESGSKKEADKQWENLIARAEKEKSIIKYLLPCLEITKKIPELSVLFPYTSMNTLCFSLTTGYPFLNVGPRITFCEEYIEVTFNENESNKVHSKKELKLYIKQNIQYYGTAIQGTANDIINSN